jgi:hypothetical protein
MTPVFTALKRGLYLTVCLASAVMYQKAQNTCHSLKTGVVTEIKITALVQYVNSLFSTYRVVSKVTYKGFFLKT